MPGPTRCFFGDTVFSRGFDFTFGPGVVPSVCMLNTVPHTTGLPNVADLRFVTEGEPPFLFRDCLLEDPRLIASEQGQFWVLPVKDRRWKWQFGYIHGNYNVSKPDGSYLRPKTPQELAALLLDAMGEFNYDVSGLPNDTRPEVRWEGHLPASELDRLCASLGCLVVLNPITDRVEIWPEGDGLPLPSGPIRGQSYSPVYPAQPQRVRVEAGPTLFQATFATEPVGLDTDGRWKHIDQISYRPSNGWRAWPPNGYSETSLPGTYNSGGRSLKLFELANATIYRHYRITGFAHGSWLLPDEPISVSQPFNGLRDIQLFDSLVETEISTSDGGLRQLPARVYARYWREWKKIQNSPVQYPDGFSFDTQKGIIQFSEPMFISSPSFFSEPIRPADIRIECAFNLVPEGIAHRQYTLDDIGGPTTTPTRLIQRPEISAQVIYRYSNNGDIVSSSGNTADTYQRLFYWRDAALEEYGLQNGGTVNYQKLVPLSPDGLTLQITWSGGGLRAARTTVSQAQRHNRYVRPLDEYRDRLAAKRSEQILAALAVTPMLRLAAGGNV